MKVAGKSLRKRAASALGRATLTLSAETYAKIDALRGEESRSAWVQSLIGQEEARRAREQFVAVVREQYTPAVCRETLAVNDEFVSGRHGAVSKEMQTQSACEVRRLKVRATFSPGNS